MATPGLVARWNFPPEPPYSVAPSSNESWLRPRGKFAKLTFSACMSGTREPCAPGMAF